VVVVVVVFAGDLGNAFLKLHTQGHLFTVTKYCGDRVNLCVYVCVCVSRVIYTNRLEPYFYVCICVFQVCRLSCQNTPLPVVVA